MVLPSPALAEWFRASQESGNQPNRPAEVPKTKTKEPSIKSRRKTGDSLRYIAARNGDSFH
jgi:hypothetical protein